MGLLSKLFGDKNGLGEILSEVTNAIKQESVNLHESEQKKTTAAPVETVRESAVKNGPSGFSWGPDMPAEENQFNYKGTYKEYFDNVFRSEFSTYKIESADANNGRSTVFTFWDGSRKALVVELLSEKSSAYKLRTDCKAEGVPYLRYYYDHHGWWNTREYVKQRTRNALGG